MKKLYRYVKKAFKGDVFIDTERLSIRYVIDEDWEDMLKLFTDFSNSPYVYLDLPKPLDEEGAIYRTQRYADSRIFYAVSLKDEEEVFAYICIHDDGPSHDVGYCFRSDYHGKGYATEALTALLRFYAEHYDVKKFTAGTGMENAPSVNLLTRLGFELVSTEPNSFFEGHTFESGNFVLDASKLYL